MDRVRYPELKVLLERRFEERWRQSGGKGELPPLRVLAREIHEVTGVAITHSSLHGWLVGSAKPHPTKMSALARFFAPNRPDEQEQLKKALLAATHAIEEPVEPMEIIETESRGLSIGVIPFPGFCELDKKVPKGFLDRLINHYLSFSGLAFKEPEFKDIKVSQVEDALCQRGEVDMVIGLFLEPSRLRSLWFYSELPILIPLNGVGLIDQSDRESLLQSMTELNNYFVVEKAVNPIIDPTELGGLFVTQFLGVHPDHYHAVDYNLARYAAELLRLSSGPPPNRVPMCVIDEVSCCIVKQLVSELKTRPHQGTPNEDRIQLLSWHKADSPLFPRYRYGLAIARKHLRWRQYFCESFELFLESNPELVAKLYLELCRGLLKSFKTLPESGPMIANWLSFTRDEKRRISATWDAIIDTTIRKVKQSDLERILWPRQIDQNLESGDS